MQWIIAAASALAFLIGMILLIVALGIQISIYFDYTTMSGCVDIYIFNKLLIMKLRIFECQRNIYIQRNRKELKKIKLTQKANKGIKIDFEKIPKITLCRFNFACVFGNDDLAVLGQLFGIASSALPCFDMIFSNKIKVKDKKIRLYPMYTTTNMQFNCQIIIKFSIFKILFFVLHTLIKTNIQKTFEKKKVKL